MREFFNLFYLGSIVVYQQKYITFPLTKRDILGRALCCEASAAAVEGGGQEEGDERGQVLG